MTLNQQLGAGLSMKWRELDGPVVLLPTRRGFGSVIIERVLPFDLQGTATVQYPPEGFEADFLVPEVHIAPPASLKEFAQRLRARHVPFIFATGYGQDTKVSHFDQVATVSKPYDREQLAAAILIALTRL